MYESLENWLSPRVGASRVRVIDATLPKSGYSAETLVLAVEIDGQADRLVLRKETPDPAVYPQQVPGLDVEIDIQYRVMSALAAHGVPIAQLVGYCADTAVLGTPFFVMRYVEGAVPTENPNYVREGFFFDAEPAQRRQLVLNGLGVMASVHAVDWRAAGLEWLSDPGRTPGTEAQLDIWQSYADRELDGRHHKVLEAGWNWLRANLAADAEITINWGDARPGNIIWRDFAPRCATDFEAACITNPLVDLGWWLMFDRWSHENAAGAPPRLDGEPTRDEQRDHYAALTGRDVSNVRYYEIFAAARYCAIVVRVMNRTVARGQLPADQTIWRDNGATDCLRDLLADTGG